MLEALTRFAEGVLREYEHFFETFAPVRELYRRGEVGYERLRDRVGGVFVALEADSGRYVKKYYAD